MQCWTAFNYHLSMRFFVYAIKATLIHNLILDLGQLQDLNV